jgi:enediyne core biosynthesis thioesterase
MKRTYDYRHIVTFQDTNVVGNVYFANHLAWQGACRELFLRDHAPGVLQRLPAELALVTVSCQCDYLAELAVFDEVVLKMSLAEALQSRLDLRFDYVRTAPGGEELVAIGRNRIGCMKRDGHRMVPAPIPDELYTAALQYR